MKNTILFLVSLFLCVIPITTAFADEEIFVTNSGGEISLDDYNYLLQTYSAEKIINFTQDDLNILLADDYIEIGSSEKLIKTTYAFDENGNIVKTYIEEISRLEPINGSSYISPMFYSNCGSNCQSYTTEYKKLTLTVSYGASMSVTVIDIKNEWTKIPKIKKFDIIGFKIVEGDTHLRINTSNTYISKQEYDGNTIEYSFDTNGNTIKETNGVGQVMNIVDSTTTSLKNTMKIYLNGSPQNTTINASYQHASTTNITMDNAKDVSFGASENGYTILGGTFKYKNSIASKYDQTQGVSISFISPV